MLVICTLSSLSSACMCVGNELRLRSPFHSLHTSFGSAVRARPPKHKNPASSLAEMRDATTTTKLLGGGSNHRDGFRQDSGNPRMPHEGTDEGRTVCQATEAQSEARVVQTHHGVVFRGWQGNK